jgi:hypothetical protein
MRHIIAAAASLAMALGASLMVPQPAAAVPGGGTRGDDAEVCKQLVEEFGGDPESFQSVGECMGYIRSNSTSDQAQLCRSLRPFFPSPPWPFVNFGECVNYMREFED